MMEFKLMLAQDEIQEVLNHWKLDSTTRTGLIIFAAAGVVTVLALVWAIFFRKPIRRHGTLHEGHARSRRRHREHRSEESPVAESEPADSSRRRKRRRRREHRPRNPTLAETGGLPPPREDGSSHPHLS